MPAAPGENPIPATWRIAMTRPLDSIAPRGLPLLACVSILLCALAAPSPADVTIKERIVAVGIGGFGDGTTDVTRAIAGDKSRDDVIHVSTRPGKTVVGGKPRSTSTIMRLDRDRVWNIDDPRRQYTERSFAALRAGAEGSLRVAGAQKTSDVEMEYQVDVERTGRKRTVNGYPAEQVIVTLTAKPKGKAGGEAAAGFAMRMEEWLSNEVLAQDELTAFQSKLALKLGMDPGLQRIRTMMTAQYGAGLRAMADQLKDSKGYPVRTILSVGPVPAPPQGAETQGARADGGAGEPTMTVTTNLLSVSTGPAIVSFDVPAGYTKVTPKAGPKKQRTR
jgi:hypothetical protein